MGTIIFIGQTVDEKYEVIKGLGESPVGQVYEARHRSLGHKVALKFLDIDSDRSEELIERFQRRSRELSSVDSEHIVRTKDMGKLPDGTPYLVSDFLDGEDLTEVIRWKGHLMPERAALLAIQVCGVLQLAHEQGVHHFDLKPGNLLILRQDDGAEVVRVRDWSIDLFYETAGTEGHDSPYIAPEQLDNSATIDRRADIYALGVILHEMLTGSPFVDKAHRGDAMPTLDGPLPQGFTEIVSRATSADPNKRFSTMTDLAEALLPYVRKQGREQQAQDEVPSKVVSEQVTPPEAERDQSSTTAHSQYFGQSSPSQPRPPSQPISPSSSSPGPSVKHWAIGIGFGLVLATITAVVLSSIDSAGGFGAVFGGSSKVATSVIETGQRGSDFVDVTVHVMSQCPFAVKTLDALTPVARSLGPRMKLKLHYVGRDQSGELTSMHGESEVQGDKLQLCVEAHAQYEQWLNFLDCQNEQWRQIPEHWQRCASSSGANVSIVGSCYSGEESDTLLRRSFQISSEAGARGSPTIFIAGERYSGGRTTEAFTRAVCAHYDSGPPAVCGNLEPSTEVKVVVLSDRRCRHVDCDTGEEERTLKSRILGARFSRVEYNTPEGRSLFSESKLRTLPAFLIDSEVDGDEEAKATVSRSYRREGRYYVKSIGRFDPLEGSWIERPTVGIRYLIDSRCKTRECESVSRFETFIKRQVPGSTAVTFDYVTPDGTALWRFLKSQPRPGAHRDLGLPIALFSKEIELEDEAFARLKKRLVEMGDGYLFQLGAWNPEQEICDNRIDDDNDHMADCEDPECLEQMSCRIEKSRELRVFVMSHCPFAIKVLDAMEEVLDNFGHDRSKIDFRVEFVGELRDGELHSMRGEEEVAEDLRQICAQHHYGDRYQFMDYILCRNKNMASREWEVCATGAIRADVIRECAEGSLGRQLLLESFELSKALGFTGSPSWLLGNRYSMQGRDPETIKNEFCAHNELPECSRLLTKSAAR